MPLKVDKKGQTASRPHLGKTLKTRRQFFHQNNESREIPFWKARAFPGKPYHHPQCIPLSHEKSSTNWIHVFLLDFPHYFFGGPGFHFHFDKYETKQKIVRCYKHFFIWKHLHCHPGLCSLFVIRKSTNHVWKKNSVHDGDLGIIIEMERFLGFSSLVSTSFNFEKKILHLFFPEN